MPLTMRYSVQPSVLSPSGFSGEYGRMQVDYRPIINEVTIAASDYDLIASNLAEGRVIRLIDDTGRAVGDFVAGLAGGFDIATFTQATKADSRVSFKPTQVLLASAREAMTFEQVPTVQNDPTIIDSIFTYESGGVPVEINNGFILGNSGRLRINGTFFVKGNTSISLSQYKGGVTPTLVVVTFQVPFMIGPKYLEIMLTDVTLSAPGIVTSITADVEWTKLLVQLTDNSRRQAEIAVVITD